MSSFVGDSIPPNDIHGVSVSLPTWEDTIGWSSREPRVLNAMKTGYPRFFIPRIVDNLAGKLLYVCHLHDGAPELAQEATAGNRRGLMLQTLAFAKLCKQFLIRKGVLSSQIYVYTIDVNGACVPSVGNCNGDNVAQNLDIHMVSYPAENFKLAKAFWQHTGFGISSRCAEYWLANLEFDYLKVTDHEHDYLPFAKAEASKKNILNRLAKLVSTQDCSVTSEDVFLYPSGMSAITHTAMAAMAMRGKEKCKVAIFGFLYVDTFKVLTTVHDLDYVLYGHAAPSEIDQLESCLSQGDRVDALYLEFPGNPLLQSPDIFRLRSLSKKYQFLLIVDDTIGTSINVSLIDHCDIICTSLTKMFSGGCNVMGGSIILNPRSQFHNCISLQLTTISTDAYFPRDVIIMDRNSHDFASRVITASRNADMIVQILKHHCVVSHVYYPKGSPTQHIYDQFKCTGGEYGFLLSIVFHEPKQAIAFYDNLNVAKGPSLGTNFTLACAYTLLAHYNELEWAAEHDVVKHLIRISVGVEDGVVLAEAVKKALDAAVAVDASS